MEITRLSQSRSKSGHPQFFGYYRIKNNGTCLSGTVIISYITTITTISITAPTDTPTATIYAAAPSAI